MPAKLDDVVDALESIAPLELAEEWDNVGLLIRPTRPRNVSTVMLTIDLTEAVLEEAIARKAGLIVAYHPPIFSPLKRLLGDAVRAVKQRIAVRCIEAGVAVYSPHTALDAVPGGVTDWLCDGLGEGRADALKAAQQLPAAESYKLITFVPHANLDALRDALADAGAGHIGDYSHCSFNIDGVGTFRGGESTKPTIGKKGRLETVAEARLEMVCGPKRLAGVIAALRGHHPYEEPAFEIYRLEPRPMRDTGAGRVMHLDKPIGLPTLVRRIKKHLQLQHVRIAAPKDVRAGRKKIRDIAACPGAGASLFEGLMHAAYLTGEMRHHDVLAKVEQGAAVILTEHTHSERGYLPVLKKKLREQFGQSVRIDISKKDAEPLQIV